MGRIVHMNNLSEPYVIKSGMKLLLPSSAYPVEVAEYAIAQGIEHEPAFAWWIRHVVRQNKRNISKVKSKYWTRTHKFGIEIPKTVEEAIQLDKKNGRC